MSVARLVAGLLAGAALLAPAEIAAAQDSAAAAPAGPASSPRADRVPPLFASLEPLTLTITADLRSIMRERGQESTWHAATVSYMGDSGDTVTVQARLRTRGIFRLRRCQFPPLRLNFRQREVRGTVFAAQDRPKLVTHCFDRDSYEQYVMQEYLLYRVQSLVTPFAHRVRLARITYVDESGSRRPVTRTAILLEDPDDLATRNGGEILDAKGARSHDLDSTETAVLGLFQYMIRNTDFSVPALHNIQLVQTNLNIYPVAYDFDWSGIIAVPYAAPDTILPIRNVITPLYRGYCAVNALIPAAVEKFNSVRERVFELHHETPQLDRRRRETMHQRFEEFYRTINDPRRLRREVLEQCREG